MPNLNVAIIGAMPEEIGEIEKHLSEKKEIFYGDLKLIKGKWINKSEETFINITTCWSGWGKVSAARAATRVISSSNNDNPINFLIFTGVAGSADKSLSQWDVVIPSYLVQHDMDARPFFDEFVIPVISTDKILVEKNLLKWAECVLKNAIKNNSGLSRFGKLKTGTVATGDKFIGDKKILDKLSKQIPNLLAVEMEGAAVAQVAFQEKVPFLIVRTISDNADEKAALSFEKFLSLYKFESWKIIEILLKNLTSASF